MIHSMANAQSIISKLQLIDNIVNGWHLKCNADCRLTQNHDFYKSNYIESTSEASLLRANC